MKILSFVHGYPPDLNAGAEWMLHAVNKFMQSRGHEIKVMTRGGDRATIKNGKTHYRKATGATEFDGIPISFDGSVRYRDTFGWADIVITHLDRTGKALNLCRDFQKPLFHLIHNTHYNDVICRIWRMNNYVVYNSEWVKQKLDYPMENTVLFPPVNPKDYDCKSKGKAIVLVNCNEAKGGHVLVDLAKRFPDRKFIGVFGYADQIIGDLPNLEYIENNADICSVYKQAGIVIMPSSYESWGRVAVEAMSAGVPVIAHPTPGLIESIGDGGIFADRDNIDEWEAAIKKLDNADFRKEAVKYGKDRAAELWAVSEKQLIELEKMMQDVSHRPVQ